VYNLWDGVLCAFVGFLFLNRGSAVFIKSLGCAMTSKNEALFFSRVFWYKYFSVISFLSIHGCFFRDGFSLLLYLLCIGVSCSREFVMAGWVKVIRGFCLTTIHVVGSIRAGRSVGGLDWALLRGSAFCGAKVLSNNCTKGDCKNWMWTFTWVSYYLLAWGREHIRT